jgi:NADH-quinone oxidoreductase subunit L
MFEIFLVLFPFIGAIITFISGNRYAFWSGYTFGLLLFLGTAFLFWNYTEPLSTSYNWISFGSIQIPFSLYIDELSLVMLLIATGLGFLDIHFSREYMGDEPEQRRYHSKILFFIGGMVLLVTAGDMISLFFGWELMGVASYLLIGFWHQRNAPADAGQQAFLYTRFGDIFLFASIGLLFYFGDTLNLLEISETEIPKDIAYLIAIFIFISAIGKSGQFPLFPWLMNAMEGPTTVSALIHGATMVNSGIYIIARLFDFFSYSEALPVVLGIAGISAFVGATSAIVQKEMKKSLAYSTMSHLSLAFAGLGAGLLSAGVGHLLNHAIFKALLFLGIGAVILLAHHKKDIWEIRGIGKGFPTLAIFLGIGAFSLSGIPPFGGFFSKDEVLWSADNILITVAGLLSVVYITRIWTLIFRGDEVLKIEAKLSRVWTLFPLGVMGVVTLLLGLFHTEVFQFLGYSAEHPEPLFQVLAVLTILILGYATYRFYINLELIEKLSKQPLLEIIHKILFNGYYIQKMISLFTKHAFLNFSKGVLWSDKTVVDGVVNSSKPASEKLFQKFIKVEKIGYFWLLGVVLILIILEVK